MDLKVGALNQLQEKENGNQNPNLKDVWEERIKQCKESGLMVKEWCNKNNVNVKTYYYHLKRLRNKNCEQTPVAVAILTNEHHKEKIRSASQNAYKPTSDFISSEIPILKIRIGDVLAEIPEGVSEYMITTLVRGIRNA